ncbi:MAG: lysophospholipase L1-like esterase [Akkermansiaceae bacterium]
MKNNNFPVELAKSIQFTGIHDFEKETRRMPNFVLHELAHAYHNHLLGDDHPGILTAFNAAKKSSTYQNLVKRSGDPKKPYRISDGETYAMSNQMEYFAEATEAYFHENDYYPHRRLQLIEHDPKVVPVLEKVWGVTKPTHPVLAANRILFLGDSITNARHFVTDLQAALHLQGHTPEVMALGLSSEGVTGLTEPGHPFPRPDITERLDRALAKTKPDLVIACYGMNDGIYHPFSDDRFHAYQKGIQSLIEKVKASGAKLILLTPPPFDAKAPGAAKNIVGPEAPVFSWRTVYQDYDRDVIARYAKYILTLKPQVTYVIDIHTPITQQPPGTLTEDGIHPTPQGHRIIAGAIYKTLFNDPLPQLPADLVSFYKSRQTYLSPAWLTHTGHTRPGVKPGLPLKEAQARAAFTIR